MARTLATLLLGLALAAAPGCGRKGALVLPPSRAPLPAGSLTAEPGPGAVLLRWANPVKTVAGTPVGEIAAVEVWVFERGLPPAGAPALAAADVERSARLVRRIARPEFASFADPASPGALAYPYALAPGGAGTATLAFTVRVVDGRGRASEFAAPVAFAAPRRAAGVDGPGPEGVS